jgi:hypothetical protein
MSPRLPSTVLLAVLAAPASAGEIRGRVLVDGKPAAGVAVSVLPSGYPPVSLPGVAVPSPTLTLVLAPGGSLEIQVGPQTLALPQPVARLLGADGRVYVWSAFTTDGTIRMAGPVRRRENVVPGRYTPEVEDGVRREAIVTEGGRSALALP